MAKKRADKGYSRKIRTVLGRISDEDLEKTELRDVLDALEKEGIRNPRINPSVYSRASALLNEAKGERCDRADEEPEGRPLHCSADPEFAKMAEAPTPAELVRAVNLLVDACGSVQDARDFFEEVAKNRQ